MVKIVLSGCNGKMGQSIAKIVQSRSDCEISAGVDINPVQKNDFEVYAQFGKIAPQNCDVIIDFSNPAALDDILDYALKNNTPCVLCSTGYYPEQLQKIKDAAAAIPVFQSGNMSLGINLLIELAKKAALALHDTFDIEIIEKHHNQKIDAPSGTAVMLGDEISSVLPQEPQYVYDRHSYRKSRSKSEIGFHSVRGGTIVGEHDVIFAGNDEIVTLSHSAGSKEVFAVGAVNAAVFLKDKPAGLYDMKELLKEKLDI
ncbi:MAG: 4-hydroxy-tetrahydrodipicolinate reductase [Oscillospiraceae bacterium]|jgi:4-hydroxy-tetrahydrodipicolinate reductase|nr:4-hydroxy-tetrahydrodipicolinate reductase [Oscillospiraceae bacterium]